MKIYRATFTVQLPDGTRRECVIDPIAVKTERDAYPLLHRLVVLAVSGQIVGCISLEEHMPADAPTDQPAEDEPLAIIGNKGYERRVYA